MSVVSVLVFGGLSVAIWSGALGGFPPVFGPILLGAAVVMLLGLILGIVLSRRDTRRVTSWYLAAAERGFSYVPELRSPGLPGLMFRSGEKVVASDVVDALASEHPFMAGSLIGQYATESSTPRMLPASFAALPLPRAVPNILLLGTGIGMLRLAGVGLAGRQKLSLEGDFDRSFTLYCPEGYERDALYIFTPDLMQLLVDSTAGCDVELVDDWMFVYSRPGRYRDAAAIDRLVATTEVMHRKLQRQTGAYADERSAPLAAQHAPVRTVSPQEHAARAGSVATGGRRLATKTSPLQRVLSTIAFLPITALAVWFILTEVLPLIG